MSVDLGDLVLLLGRPAAGQPAPSPPQVDKTSSVGVGRWPRRRSTAAYRLDYDRAKQTSNGVIRTNGGATSWWAFSSACTATGCAATGTKLDDASHQVAKTTGTGNAGVLHFVDGHWQGEPRQVQAQCRHARERADRATQSETVVWSLTPRTGRHAARRADPDRAEQRVRRARGDAADPGGGDPDR